MKVFPYLSRDHCCEFSGVCRNTTVGPSHGSNSRDLIYALKLEFAKM